jgi:hypothetical protein
VTRAISRVGYSSRQLLPTEPDEAAKRALEPYFDGLDDPATMIVPISRTVRLQDRDDERRIERATELMSTAAAGRRPKRPPLSARAEPNGTYTILDGKSTHANLERLGFEAVPLILVA